MTVIFLLELAMWLGSIYVKKAKIRNHGYAYIYLEQMIL